MGAGLCGIKLQARPPPSHDLFICWLVSGHCASGFAADLTESHAWLEN